MLGRGLVVVAHAPGWTVLAGGAAGSDLSR